mmetsp:Transcript_10529/g.64617  ORF Transcript_10529/g.64617 Transcript_10529/m.64617 type:complete len:80 (-) Transcript_10529:536-775(-)
MGFLQYIILATCNVISPVAASCDWRRIAQGWEGKLHGRQKKGKDRAGTSLLLPISSPGLRRSLSDLSHRFFGIFVLQRG